jgi:hypothetical protein
MSNNSSLPTDTPPTSKYSPPDSSSSISKDSFPRDKLSDKHRELFAVSENLPDDKPAEDALRDIWAHYFTNFKDDYENVPQGSLKEAADKRREQFQLKRKQDQQRTLQESTPKGLAEEIARVTGIPINMPVHPKEENVQEGSMLTPHSIRPYLVDGLDHRGTVLIRDIDLTDMVAQQSKDSSASTHPMHQSGSDKAHAMHHQANPVCCHAADGWNEANSAIGPRHGREPRPTPEQGGVEEEV